MAHPGSSSPASPVPARTEGGAPGSSGLPAPLASAGEQTSSSTPVRLLGLDVGTRRIGVAVSDGLGLTAQPVLTLRRTGRRDDLRSIARLARRHGCSGFVIGNPLHLSGETSPQTLRVHKLATELEALSGLPITFWDERLTTREAHQILYEAGKPRQQHAAVVDQLAAVLILQGYLDAHRSSAAQDLPASGPFSQETEGS